jgi:hypothetical protein
VIQHHHGAMLVPIRGRFRVSALGYQWTSAEGKETITERAIARWKVVPAGTSMAVEIANVAVVDAGLSAFLERWGLPIIKDETKLASITTGEFRGLVASVRKAVGLAVQHDRSKLQAHIEEHAFFAAQPRSTDGSMQGDPRVVVECRDPAAMVWLELVQRDRIGVAYRQCPRCEAYFAVGEAYRHASCYCSDDCRVATGDATTPARE